MLKAVVLDCETTGLLSTAMLELDRQPEVIEFYAALVTFNSKKPPKVHAELDLLVRPTTKINEAKSGRHNITKITGLTNEMLANAPMFKEVADQIFKFIEQGPIAIAHNISYDREILDNEASRLNKQIKWPRLLCTVEQTVHLRGDRLKLSELHEHLFREKFTGAHRAKVDVQALIRCVAELHRQEVL